MSRVRRFHVTLGLALSAVYLYVVTHVETLLPNLVVATSLANPVLWRAERGVTLVYCVPVAAIVCFLFAPQLKWRLSPRTPPLFDYLLSEGAFYIAGYGLLLVGIGVLLLFK